MIEPPNPFLGTRLHHYYSVPNGGFDITRFFQNSWTNVKNIGRQEY